MDPPLRATVVRCIHVRLSRRQRLFHTLGNGLRNIRSNKDLCLIFLRDSKRICGGQFRYWRRRADLNQHKCNRASHGERGHNGFQLHAFTSMRVMLIGIRICRKAKTLAKAKSIVAEPDID